MNKRDALVGLALGATWPLLINGVLVALVAHAVPLLTHVVSAGSPAADHPSFVSVVRLVTGVAIAAIVGAVYGSGIGLWTRASPMTGWVGFVVAALSASLAWHLATSRSIESYLEEWAFPEAWMAILLVAVVALAVSSVRRRRASGVPR